MIKVLLVDDHILLRLGLTEVIESHGGMKVVADVATGEEAFSAYEEHSPDVVVMDFRMPEESGAQLTERLLKSYPDARVLILSVYEGEEDVWRALQSGAVGYLTKGADAPVMLDAIVSVAEGETYFPAKIVQKIKRRRERNHLTHRELDVLTQLVHGMSNKEITEELGISGATVKLHLKHVFQKLGVSDRTQAVLAAVQRGILHLDD